MKSYLVIFLCVLISSALFGQKEMTIAEVQGTGDKSPSVEQKVKLSGVVTARTRTGFFLQTPDDKADSNKNTSEGIFVFTRTEPPAEADVANIVSVTGTVEEFKRENDVLATRLP
mgnify:FL=1